MQAKRLFHIKHYEHRFTVNSGFESVDRAQHKRMERLRDWAQCDFIRYLLYCPRPSTLDKNVREVLCSARSRILANDIFDYSLGLELRDDFLSENPTVAAGVFVASLDKLPNKLLAVHASLFRGVSPFSWFIVSQLAQTKGIYTGEYDRKRHPGGGVDHNLNNPIVEALIRGDVEVFSHDSNLMEVLGDPKKAHILPAHTVIVEVINGIERQRNKEIY